MILYILSKSDHKTVLDFHWILYWIIGGFLLNIKSTKISGRFYILYVRFTRFPYLASQWPPLESVNPTILFSFERRRDQLENITQQPDTVDNIFWIFHQQKRDFSSKRQIRNLKKDKCKYQLYEFYCFGAEFVFWIRICKIWSVDQVSIKIVGSHRKMIVTVIWRE